MVENYNMTIARNMVQGVDIWLNNPKRPLEASGTSGQKVCINAIPNFSILDGWWCEGFNGKNGWTIGDDTVHANEYYQDNADSNSIYDILEQQIVPTYYERNSKGVPVKWVKVMKESLRSNTWLFSTHRMVQDYTSNMYIKCMLRNDDISSSNYDYVKALSGWKKYIRENWKDVEIRADKSTNGLKNHKLNSGDLATIKTTLFLGNIAPDNVKVEIFYGTLGKNNEILNSKVAEMTVDEQFDSNTYSYSASIMLLDGGEYGYTIRVLPYNKDLTNKFELGLVKWSK
jgi:starch phosphorylase